MVENPGRERIHFLIKCPAYDYNLRATLLIQARVNGLPESFQFCKIMSSIDLNIIHALAEFIIEANKLKRVTSIGR